LRETRFALLRGVWFIFAPLRQGTWPARPVKNIMTTQTNGNPILEKTRELCAAIVAEPGLISIRQRITAFMADDKSRTQYESLMMKGQALQEKQQRSLPLSGEEISEFEREREALLANPVATGFLHAQQELHDLQESIHQRIAKTLELGRVPTEEELSEGSCGAGCGCHH
jgi:cell fate (sporulation/competence/biofilm development) regulator YlbF (YheA/YmcA/DUF963 family)